MISLIVVSKMVDPVEVESEMWLPEAEKSTEEIVMEKD
jgi:hypothetical protein